MILLTLPISVQALLVGAAIIGMLVLLSGMKELMHSDFKDQEKRTRDLRHEVESEENVISPNSIFHQFLTGSKNHRESKN